MVRSQSSIYIRLKKTFRSKQQPCNRQLMTRTAHSDVANKTEHEMHHVLGPQTHPTVNDDKKIVTSLLHFTYLPMTTRLRNIDCCRRMEIRPVRVTSRQITVVKVSDAPSVILFEVIAKQQELTANSGQAACVTPRWRHS